MKRFITFIVVFALLTAVVLGIVWFLYTQSLKPVASAENRVPVKIEKGISVRSIASLLHQKGLIRSEGAFLAYVRFNDLTPHLQAGHFVLSSHLSTPEIADALKNGRSEEMVITIPEGFTVRDIDALLAEQGLIEEGAFVRCANECDVSAYTFLPSVDGLLSRGGRVEGYLFPDTYYIASESFTAEGFTNRLLSTFQAKIVEGYQSEIDSSGRSLHELVTMASLIEKEAREDSERPMVSGILWKRFDDDRGLGVDATVRYVMEKPTEPITVADLNTNSPYNTRKFRGLPPGPIANAGLESLEAAISPQESEYWYYLHGNDGQIHYAVTNEEHNVNKYLYIR